MVDQNPAGQERLCRSPRLGTADQRPPPWRGTRFNPDRPAPGIRLGKDGRGNAVCIGGNTPIAASLFATFRHGYPTVEDAISYWTRNILTALLLGLLGPGTAAYAQTATLRGFVTEAANGEPLQSVNLALTDILGGLYGGATDADGLYIVPGLQPGRYTLRISFIGFEMYRDTLSLAPREIRTLDVALRQRDELLGELVVEAEQEGRVVDLVAGLERIQPQDIERVPGPDVAGDLASYLTTLPGVVIVGDQGGQFYVRGGEPTQNMVLLDGMLVYQPFHILSYYSAFPSEVLRTVDLHAGGFGARFGGRISSVIDAWSRNGNNQRIAGSGSVSPFVVGAHLEGPLSKSGSFSFLASIRQSVLKQGAARLIDRPVPLVFSDVFAKIHGRANRNGRVSFTGLRTFDRGRVGDDTGRGAPDEVRWRNDAFGGRYLFLPGNLPILAEFLGSISKYTNELGPPDAPVRSSTTSRINMEANITHYTSFADLKWGLFARTLTLTSDLGGLYQDLTTSKEYVTEAGLYVAPEFRIGRRSSLTPSLRIHNFPSKGQVYVEPRVRGVWARGPHQVSGAAGLFHQEIVGISDRRDAASTFTAWTVVPYGRVPQAFHLLLGYQRQVVAGLEVVAETYYKRIQNLYISEWTARPRLTTRLQQADGRVLGMDLRVEARRPNFYGYINYGLSWVQYEARQASLKLWFGGDSYRFRPAHDRRHQINVLVATERAGFDLSARWQFGSGRPFNRALGFDGFLLMDGSVDVFEDPGDRRVIYERPFNGILPTYHRLDLSAERTFDFGAGSVVVQASVINVYDRANIFFLDLFTLQRADQLPLIPSIGIKVSVD